VSGYTASGSVRRLTGRDAADRLQLATTTALLNRAHPSFTVTNLSPLSTHTAGMKMKTELC